MNNPSPPENGEAKTVDLIDSHVHLNFNRFDSDLDEVAERWRAAGIRQLVHSCCSPAEFEQLQAIADRFPEVFLSVGMHPLDVDRWTASTADEIRRCVDADSRVVAIGETGLDFFKADNVEEQLLAFRTHIEIARERDLPVIVHCRDAAAAARDLLQDMGPVRGVMHCWGGTPEETYWFVRMGMHISFSGVLTFKNAATIRASAEVVPPELLLVETDCPFLAPVPHRGKRNEPAFVASVAEHLAAIRGLSFEEIASQTATNARNLFCLPHPDVSSTQQNPTIVEAA